jgi:hypothetical protein
VTANSDAVARNSAALATATGREVSIPSGTIGSSARRSRSTSAPASAIVAATSAMTGTDVQS